MIFEYKERENQNPVEVFYPLIPLFHLCGSVKIRVHLYRRVSIILVFSFNPVNPVNLV